MTLLARAGTREAGGCWPRKRCREGCSLLKGSWNLGGRGIKIRIARRGIEAKIQLGRHRWVVERTISWVLRFKRLGLRYDRTEAMLPLLLLSVTLINLRRLRRTTE